MKTPNNIRFLLPVLHVTFGLMFAGTVAAQTYTILHKFNGSDGANPNGGLVLYGNSLYGTTHGGGNVAGSISGEGNGTIFAIHTDGTGFTNLHVFTTGVFANNFGYYNNDGAWPETSGLVLVSNMVYGTTQFGGNVSAGTIFGVSTDGTGFRILSMFTAGGDPSNPGTNSYAIAPLGLFSSGNLLYGTGWGGGINDNGTVFAINTDGSGLAVSYNFSAYYGYGVDNSGLNSDGSGPEGVILSGNMLYGTSTEGGVTGSGTVFKVSTNGSGFTPLHSFSVNTSANGGDGAVPNCGLVLSGNTLYGTTQEAGTGENNGTLFSVNTDGTGFRVVHAFTGGADGANPRAGLVLSRNTLYGTTYIGGKWNTGVIFAVNTDGTNFTTLYNFDSIVGDGYYPQGTLLLSSNILYGTTYEGGTNNNGVVFSLTLPVVPHLSISRPGINVILMWPTNAVGFTLQSTTNLGAAAVWTTNSPAPVVVNGQNTVTNPISGSKQFFRLSQ
jgi:uncharacterized repeat protein (TIGR03803 family)